MTALNPLGFLGGTLLLTFAKKTVMLLLLTAPLYAMDTENFGDDPSNPSAVKKMLQRDVPGDVINTNYYYLEEQHKPLFTQVFTEVAREKPLEERLVYLKECGGGSWAFTTPSYFDVLESENNPKEARLEALKECLSAWNGLDLKRILPFYLTMLKGIKTEEEGHKVIPYMELFTSFQEIPLTLNKLFQSTTAHPLMQKNSLVWKKILDAFIKHNVTPCSQVLSWAKMSLYKAIFTKFPFTQPLVEHLEKLGCPLEELNKECQLFAEEKYQKSIEKFFEDETDYKTFVNGFRFLQATDQQKLKTSLQVLLKKSPVIAHPSIPLIKALYSGFFHEGDFQETLGAWKKILADLPFESLEKMRPFLTLLPKHFVMVGDKVFEEFSNFPLTQENEGMRRAWVRDLAQAYKILYPEMGPPEAFMRYAKEHVQDSHGEKYAPEVQFYGEVLCGYATACGDTVASLEEILNLIPESQKISDYLRYIFEREREPNLQNLLFAIVKFGTQEKNHPHVLRVLDAFRMGWFYGGGTPIKWAMRKIFLSLLSSQNVRENHRNLALDVVVKAKALIKVDCEALFNHAQVPYLTIKEYYDHILVLRALKDIDPTFSQQSNVQNIAFTLLQGGSSFPKERTEMAKKYLENFFR